MSSERRATVALATADGRVLCPGCRVADTFWTRLRGLLGRASLAPDEGLLIRGTSSVHTHFMRFPIDVVFLDADGVVLRIAEALRPWRVSSCRDARDVCELPAGAARRAGLGVGDRVATVGARPKAEAT